MISILIYIIIWNIPDCNNLRILMKLISSYSLIPLKHENHDEVLGEYNLQGVSVNVHKIRILFI